MPPFALAALAALPWLEGFAPEATTDRGPRQVVSELAEWRTPDEECVASAYGGLSLSADVVPGGARETVLASFSQGIVVLDPERQLIARAPGFPCTGGSADQLVALAAGEAWIGTPVIALAATTGGHAESVTWLSLYRVGEGGQLVAVFTGAVERHTGNVTRTGTVVVVPGGLLVRDPSGQTSLWIYERAAGRYVVKGAFGPAS